MKSLHLICSTLLQSAFQNRLQVLFTLLAIMVGSAGLSAVLILNNAAQVEYQNMSSNPLGLANNISALIGAKDTDKAPLTISDYSQLRLAGHVNAVAFAQFQSTLADGTPVRIIGVDAPALALFANSKGDPLGLTESLVLSPNLYTRVNADALLAKALTRQLSLPELPVFESPSQAPDGEHLIVLDLYYFTTFIQTASPNVKTTLPLEIAVVDGNEALNGLLREQLPPHLEIKTLSQPIDPASITQSLHLNLLAMSIVMFAVCFFIVINALNLLLMGRMQLFKTLRQLGIARRSLVIAQTFELALYAVIGASMGVFIGHYLATILAPTLALTLAGLFNVNLGFVQLESLHLALPMILLCIIAMLLAAVLPYQQLNNALSQTTYSQPVQANNKSKVLGLFTLALLVTAVSASWTPVLNSPLALGSSLDSSLAATFVTIACLIISGVIGLFWIYPIIIRGMTQVAERLHPLWHWSFAHSLIVANKTKLASAAFMIALVTHIGMNLMVGSFREATNTWLEQRLVADYYVYADSSDIRTINSLLEAQGIRHFARYQLDTEVSFNEEEGNISQPIRVYSYPHQSDYQQALLVDSMSQDAWQTYKAQKGVFINQQFAIRNGINLNDKLLIKINDTSKIMAVKAIYMDYGNPYAQALIAPSIFDATANSRVMAIHLDQRLHHNKASLMSLFPSTASVYSRDDILAASMQAFDKTFLITDALNIVTLLVAVFSLTTSIILLEQKNRYISALIRSFGVSKLHVTFALFTQYALLCLVAALWAIPFGIAFAWLLVTRLNVYAFQWQFPLSIEPYSITGAIVLSLIIVLALAAIPIFRRQQFSISEQLTCKE